MGVRRTRRRLTPRRCAWCQRFCVGGAWIEGRRDDDDVVAHAATMTHTICDDCVARLRASGKSV